jgi:cell division protein FtsW
MGATNFVKSHASVDTQAKHLKRMNLKIDTPMLLAVVTLLILGLVMVFSSSMQFSIRNTTTNNPYFFLRRQLVFVVLGLAVAYVAYRVDYRWLRSLAPWIMVGTIALLVAVFFVPLDVNVPKRALFSGSIQPSELAKVAVIIYLSVWISRKKDQLNSLVSGVLPLGIILGMVCALILAQPDISAMLTVMFLGGLLFFMADGSWRIIVVIILVALVAFGLIYVFSEPLFGTNYVQYRIDNYFGSWNNISKTSDHIQHSVSAIIRGGWFGTPLGEGSSKFIGLPVPWTDSIFAVIVEELGFFGGVFVIFLYGVILWRGLKIADEAPDMTGKLLAAGLTCWLVFEAFLNMGVMVNLFPVAGNALPLISYGGSMMVTSLGAIGLIFNIHRITNEKKIARERRSLDAPVDLRRGDGGRRVSRSQRFTRTP